MALPKVADAELADKLEEVFRRRGFEGTSLGLIAKATGLEKASLYHRFPGGKDEMVSAALSRVGEHFSTQVLAGLDGRGTPHEKLRAVQRGLREFYLDGELPCALDTLSLPTGNADIREGLRKSYIGWLDAFAELAREAGAAAAEARRRAQQAIVAVEGALVVSRVTRDTKPFRETVASLPEILLGERTTAK